MEGEAVLYKSFFSDERQKTPSNFSSIYKLSKRKREKKGQNESYVQMKDREITPNLDNYVKKEED